MHSLVSYRFLVGRPFFTGKKKVKTGWPSASALGCLANGIQLQPQPPGVEVNKKVELFFSRLPKVAHCRKVWECYVCLMLESRAVKLGMQIAKVQQQEKKTYAFLHQHRLFVLGTLINFSHIRWLETCIPARHEPMRPGHIRVTSTPCLQCVYWCSSFQKIFVFNSKTSRLVCGQANVVFSLLLWDIHAFAFSIPALQPFAAACFRA